MFERTLPVLFPKFKQCTFTNFTFQPAVVDLVGLGRMFYIASPSSTSFPDLKALPNKSYIDQAVPYFIIMWETILLSIVDIIMIQDAVRMGGLGSKGKTTENQRWTLQHSSRPYNDPGMIRKSILPTSSYTKKKVAGKKRQTAKITWN